MEWRFLVSAWVGLMFASGAHAQTPQGVTVRNLGYSGNGCPGNSVAAYISADAKIMTLTFDDFIASIDRQKKDTKICNLRLDLEVPAGWEYALYYLDYRGYSDLESSIIAQMKTTYRFGNLPNIPVGFMTLVGPYQRNYFQRTNLPLQNDGWSRCARNANKTLFLQTILEVYRPHSSIKGLGMLTVDTLDGEAPQRRGHNYGITWRRCR